MTGADANLFGGGSSTEADVFMSFDLRNRPWLFQGPEFSKLSRFQLHLSGDIFQSPF